MEIKEAKTKKERMLAMAAKVLGATCVNGKNEVIVLKSDYERLTKKKEDKKIYSREMFEKFMEKAIVNGVESYRCWEKAMKEGKGKLEKKKEMKQLYKEFDELYSTDGD